MDVKSLTPDMLFRVYTQCPEDPVTMVLDVRQQKDFSKRHILQAYCVRLSANGKALLVCCILQSAYVICLQSFYEQDCLIVVLSAGLLQKHLHIQVVARLLVRPEKIPVSCLCPPLPIFWPDFSPGSVGC
jgi:hypothetical protein